MRRPRVGLPAAVLAVLAVQLGGVSPVNTGPGPQLIDETALATATSVAGWQCTLPHRTHRDAPRESGSVPVLFTASTNPGGPTTSEFSGGPHQIPGFGGGPGQNPRAQITGALTATAQGAANPGPADQGPADQGDSYQVPLVAGEVLGATVRGAGGELEVRDPTGALVEGSAVDRSGSYPQTSPLPGGGNATVDHVAAVSGIHTITVRRGTPTPASTGSAATGIAPPRVPINTAPRAAAGAAAPQPNQYVATVEIFRPVPVGVQQIVLDYAGAQVDTRKFGVDTGRPQPSSLSALRAFLPGWGLTPADEPALITQITATVRANLADPTGPPVQVSDSTTGPGNFGRPDVSRVVIGGTVAEAGIETIGISESVDPGNFAREETSLVLLDRLDGPADQPVSLNHYLVGPGISTATRVEFIGHAIGNIAAHEIGHLLGSWHTDPHSGRHDLMAPGDLIGAFGLSPDGRRDTATAIVARFGQDRYDPAEGFTGIEDTRARTTIALRGLPNPNAG